MVSESTYSQVSKCCQSFLMFAILGYSCVIIADNHRFMLDQDRKLLFRSRHEQLESRKRSPKWDNMSACPRNFHRNSKTSMGTRSQNCLFDTIKMIKVALNRVGRWVQPRLAHRRKSQKTRIFSGDVIQRGMPAGYACLLLSRKSTHIFHGL